MEEKTKPMSRSNTVSSKIAAPSMSVRVALVLALLVLGGLALSACGQDTPPPTPTPTKTPTPTPATAGGNGPPATPTPPPAEPTPQPPTPTASAHIAPYTGLPVADPARLRRRPIFICVNNDAVGRAAHYGLVRADLVYEYIVDGFTLTRLTAMYHSQEADRVGPVRSARKPNIWITYMYDGALACSGGSDAIRYLLKHEVGFPYLDADIDDPTNTVYFSNVGTDYRTRLQASTQGVRRWLQETGNDKEWSRPGFAFSPEPPPFAAGSATVIRLPYPGGNQVEWRYDPERRIYLRYQGGQPHVDNETGEPITAENVVVIKARHELTDIVEDSLGTRSVDIQLYGFGDLRLFRDGLVYEGTWRADDRTPPRWLGPGEQLIPLRPGQTWIQVIRLDTPFDYQ